MRSSFIARTWDVKTDERPFIRATWIVPTRRGRRIRGRLNWKKGGLEVLKNTDSNKADWGSTVSF